MSRYPGSLLMRTRRVFFAMRFKTIALSERVVSQAEYAAIDWSGSIARFTRSRASIPIKLNTPKAP